MIRATLIGTAAVLALASSAAYAFQEQRAATPAPTEQAPAAVAPVAPGEIVAPTTGGTPVRIPGLGTLGVIPKMDFGLELLYGVAESSKRNVDPSKPESDDVLIGGRIKHKF